MRAASLHAAGKGAAAKLAEQIRRLDRPVNALLWMADSRAHEMASSLENLAPCVVGGSSLQGLIGGGSEYYGAHQGERCVALAITLPDDASVLAFHSDPHSLPDFPESTWTDWATASPSASPHLMLLAAPPTDASFPLERWLSRLDTSLPWARKVGGLLAGGQSQLWVGGTEHNGGAVGIALSGSVQLDALVCQGATAIGPSFAVTAAESGSLVRSLDGVDVASALRPTLEQFAADGSKGVLMAGISVDPSPAALPPSREPLVPLPTGAHEASYVMRQITGYFPENSALAIGASAELLEAPNVRLQLHSFSAANARAELHARASALRRHHEESSSAASDGATPFIGGLVASCLGRGESLFGGEANVESRALLQELGGQLELAGWFAGGEIGPVGRRTFVHTYTSTAALLR